ncbi:putative Rossmann-fold nucleotide-binding protein [Ereboglobus sp. PH5-5]|uniref:LOG family protein n=1 Tax=Ereboglobus sp. PH5-5 TaxID=2940529 RepID=UPI0024066F6F|nr:LOG family protein [Ereboglobus sp. PH5-5]MDF9833809.1 putative Rossmann-fold nucleotide-binding protein [Ereboglobus sp. PH5-5]
MAMNNDQFWTSLDGQVLTVRPNLSEHTVSLTIAFWPRNPAEFDFMKEHLDDLHFTERSTLARIGLEIMRATPLTVDGNRLVFDAETFLFDHSFPNAPYWKKLFRSGMPIGRLFYAPESQKLSSTEIWDAISNNALKLPNTISIDRNGSVFLTSHPVRYTLNPKLQRADFEALVSGNAGRAYLDKVQVRNETPILTVEPRSGILTSCSMYLKEHYVLLNRGVGNFGIHTSAVLLDPIKTFGTNIMLEIYNPGDQPVVNPVVSVEVFRAPTPADTDVKNLAKKRARLLSTATDIYGALDETPPKDNGSVEPPKPRTRVTFKGQNATQDNTSVFINAGQFTDAATLRDKINAAGACGYRTLIQALDAAPEDADTLLVDTFPNLPEHIELLARLPNLKLRRIIFRKPSRTHGFFLSYNAHGRLENYHDIGIDVYWHNAQLNDLYLHTYKKNHGFFIREELGRKFQESTILAMYGSAVGLDQTDTDRISSLMDKLTGFIGTNVGVLTGGGGGVMRLATEQARMKGALTGACFLELEAQPPEIGVDFFNTFQETSRHYRQKWFEVADFCIFNVGGVGTLEEIGIEMCNLKLGIRPRIPYIFYNAQFWTSLRDQVEEMVSSKRAPAWMLDYILFSNDPDEVVDFYKKTLRVL